MISESIWYGNKNFNIKRVSSSQHYMNICPKEYLPKFISKLYLKITVYSKEMFTF